MGYHCYHIDKMFLLSFWWGASWLLLLAALEALTGDMTLPRFWWLWNKQEAICIICSDNRARYKLPTRESETAVAEDAYTLCLPAFTPAQCQADLNEVRRTIAKTAVLNKYNVVARGKARLDVATNLEDRALFWNQILAFGFSGLAGLMNVCLFIALVYPLLSKLNDLSWLKESFKAGSSPPPPPQSP